MKKRIYIVDDEPKIGQMFESADRQFPGAVWSLSIGWGCDALVSTAPDVYGSHDGRLGTAAVPLAAAAYNPGENRVARIMREETGSERGSEESYYQIWDRLPKETRDYVPLMVAAARIAPDATQSKVISDEMMKSLIAKAMSLGTYYAEGSPNGTCPTTYTGAPELCNTVDDNCDGTWCNQEGFDAAESGKSLARISTVGFGIGIAADPRPGQMVRRHPRLRLHCQRPGPGRHPHPFQRAQGA